MKNRSNLKTLFRTVTAALIFGLSSTGALAVDPLSVQGNRILAGGQVRSLAGPSLFWSNTEWGAERFYNSNAVSWVKADWNATVVRAALGVDGEGGYLEDPSGNKSRVTTVVDAAIANDLYVIIDWHSHHAEDHTSLAVDFFTEMAQTYGHYDNVIYEVYNEPLQVSWSGVVKPYAETVISAIRAVDPDNLIIVGTPSWSQDVDHASWDPITNYSNIAYTLHFYAGTHGQYLRDKAQTALNNGIALFVTEWGAVNADGDGAVNYGETQAWMNFLESNSISHANWALNDKEEGASALVPGANANGGWGQGELTASGQLVRDLVRNWGGGGSSSSSSSSSSSGGNGGGLSCDPGSADVWNGGFVLSSVSVNNNGSSAISGWQITLDFPQPIQLSNGWNGEFSLSGDGRSLTVSNIGWNGNVQPGQSVSFGFQGGYSGSFQMPTCSVNG